MAMKTRKLGRTGLDVSPIAMGGAAFGYLNKASNWDPHSDEGRRTVNEMLKHGLDCGINYIDTSPLYGDGYSKTLIGEVMKTRRNDCALASKVWFEHDRQGVIDRVHESLKRLQTDRIDIVQIHGRMY
jgi:aryl-alcohol dehydrogenase-like predicted oxidoreductase